MENEEVKRLGLILAIQAEIEGMKADNIATMHTHKYVGYNMEDFQSKAEELRNIVYCHGDQL